MMPGAGLYGPGSMLSRRGLEHFLRVFEAVWCYLPTETDTLAELAPYGEAGGLRTFAPLPLGEDRQRFAQTVRDMLAHGREYSGAYRSSMAGAGEESAGWGIVSSLMGVQAEEQTRQEQWQARLLLSLQAHLDRQALEIERGLAAYAGQRAALFRALRGADEDAGGPGFTVERPPEWSREREEQILRAWGRLLVADAAQGRPGILLTDRPGVANLLFAACEVFFRQGPEKILALRVPELGQSAAEFLADNPVFRERAAAILARIGGRLHAAAGAALGVPGLADDEPSGREISAAWEGVVLDHWGRRPGGFATLTFYRLPGIEPERLFRRFCKLPDPGSGQVAAAASGLLVVLGEAEAA